MAVSFEKKQSIVETIRSLRDTHAVFVATAFHGSSVRDLERLRSEARSNGLVVIVLKNRLFSRVANISGLTGQLLYLFGADIEGVSRIIANHPNLSPALGGTTDGAKSYDAAFIQQIMSLPNRDQLLSDILAIGDVFSVITMERK